MTLPPRSTSSRAMLSAALSLLLSTSGLAKTQEPDPAEIKIRLLSEALHSRDSGDNATARHYLQQLLKLSPNDETIKRLLDSLDQAPAKKVTVAGGAVTAPMPAAAEADRLAREEEGRLNQLVAGAHAAVRAARSLAAEGHFAEALDQLDRARVVLPDNALTRGAAEALGAARAEITAAREQQLSAEAEKLAQAVPPARPALALAPVDNPVPPPAAQSLVTPAAAGTAEIAALVARGRAQYLAGEPTQAAQSFVRALELDPQNATARKFLARLSHDAVDKNPSRVQTTAKMLNEVERAWQRPGVFQEKAAVAAPTTGPSPLQEKLNAIIIPSVNFSGMELSRVVNTLSVISEEFDKTGGAAKGVNIVLVDPANANPAINLTLRNLPLKRVLDFITDSVGYQYEVQADAVVVRPGGEQSALDTQFFPISRSTVLRMTGRGNSAKSGDKDPLAGSTAAGDGGSSIEADRKGIQNFFQLAGVGFDTVKDSTLAFDGSQLIVTQTPRNLERIRNILNRYNDVRQVEIEAKFMEVQDGALEELGVNWNVGKKSTQHSGASVTDYATSNRSLADAFTSSSSGTSGSIVRGNSDSSTTTATYDSNGNLTDKTVTTTTGTSGGTVPILNSSPAIPGTNNLGVSADPLATITGIVGEFNISAVIRALSQKSGTELLSAPKLTVLSGNPATITVAQELRYPQSYGQVQSQVGTGSASGGGSAGVTITAGTPQEFTTRNVGVELKVTPTVEEDDYSISLDLNPKVTEFEGFVEYGGQSVAVSGSTTVTVPSGFYQPIFAVRELTTKVTIWDGATLVMGGLTREDTRKTNDKVPVLGNVPVLGRLFRSNGESSQKRNLLIFVTANLVSPGGSLKKQIVQGVQPNSLYQNPMIVTPAGSAVRAPAK